MYQVRFFNLTVTLALLVIETGVAVPSTRLHQTNTYLHLQTVVYDAYPCTVLIYSTSLSFNSRYKVFCTYLLKASYVGQIWSQIPVHREFCLAWSQVNVQYGSWPLQYKT